MNVRIIQNFKCENVPWQKQKQQQHKHFAQIPQHMALLEN